MPPIVSALISQSLLGMGKSNQLQMNRMVVHVFQDFQKKPAKLWTYLSDMSGRKTQVDYITINKKWKNSVHNCQSYNSFSSLGSDHRVVTAKIKLSFRKRQTKPCGDNHDWSVLRNYETSYLYSVTLNNKFDSLRSDEETITESYEKFIQASNEATKLLIPKKVKSKQKNISMDLRITEARKRTNKSIKTFVDNPSDENRDKMNVDKKQLNQIYDKVKEEQFEKVINDLDEHSKNARPKQCWKLINQLSGRKSIKQGIIKANNKQDRINKWYNHFQSLLGKEPIVNGQPEEEIQPVLSNLEIFDGPFTKEEYSSAIKELKDGKSCGPDGIPPEIFKYCKVDDIMLQFANKLLNGQKPTQWSISNVKPLPKSGDLSSTDNYWGISLTSNAAKITNKMILNRIRPKIDHHLRTNQNGFRPGRSTISHILTLRRLIEGVKSKNLKAVIVFIDFKKAFDSVHRGKMFNILKAYDIPENLVNAIKLMHDGTKARVVTPDGDTDLFDVVAGVLQGDTLAPYLFAIVLDYTMRMAVGGKEEELGFTIERRRSRRHNPVILTDTDFADDIATISEEIEQAQKMLTNIENEAAKVGLHLNSKKTEMMLFNQVNPVEVKSLEGKVICPVENFKYLGAWMKCSEKDFEIRRAQAWSACHKLNNIWSSNLSRNLKIHIFLATVEKVLLYGSETWTINKAFEKKLDGTYTRLLRMALNIAWQDMIPNEVVYGQLPSASSKVAAMRMKLAGHCIRHQEEEASKLTLWQPVAGKRNVGRRKIDYIDCLLKDCDLNNVNEMRKAMEDRDYWRKLSEFRRVGTRPK